MKRLLIISQLDYFQQPNNREHHLVDYYSRQFSHVTLVYKRRNAMRSRWGMLQDNLVPRVRITERGNVRFIEINPLLNHYPGLSRNLAGFHHTAEDYRDRSRLSMLKTIASAGLVKDPVLLASMSAMALASARGTFDVCLALGPWSNCIGFMMRSLKRVRCLVYVDRDYEPAFMVSRLRRWYASKLEVGLMRRADLVISIGRALADLREQQVRRVIAVVPTGVDYELLQRTGPAPPHPPTLVYSGNLAFWSGLDLVLAALPEIKKRVGPVRLLVVGGGLSSYETRLREMVPALGLENDVHFLGVKKRSEVAQVLGESDVGLALVQPTLFRKYAVPLKVLEYMAAGLPVIGTAGTETEQILARYECGISAPYTAEALAEAVSTVLGDPGAHRRMAENARRGSRDFAWGTLLDQEYRLIREAYEQIVPAADGVS